MLSAGSTDSYPSLRVNSWPVDQVELDATASALVAGIYFEVVALSEISPPVVPTSPPIVAVDVDLDYAWDLEKTPARLHDFLMNLAVKHPNIPPSAWLETYFLVQSMFHFAWDHPVILHNFNQEMELFYLRTFWNVASTYDKDFTEECFHALTDSRYVRCLDPSTKLILTRTMVLEASKPERKDLGSWRKSLCEVFADWVLEVEGMFPSHISVLSACIDYRFVLYTAAHPYDITASSSWVDEAVAMEVLPSELESLADVEEALEEALEADIDIEEELEAEAVDLTASMSSRVITDSPMSTSSAPAIISAAPNAVLQTLTSERMTGVRASGYQLGISGNGEDELDTSKPSPLLPPRLSVRTRPPFGSQSTSNSAASVVETGSKLHGLQTPEASSSFVAAASDGPIGNHQSAFSSTSTSASTSTGRFSSLGFSSKRSTASGSMLASTIATSFTTTIGSGSSFRVRKSFRRSGLANVEFQTEGSSISRPGSPSDNLEEKDAAGLESEAADRRKSADRATAIVTSAASPSATSSPSASKLVSFFRKLVGGRGGGRKSEANRKGTEVSWSPPLMTDGSELRSSMGVESVIHRPVHEVNGWDGKPMKRRGPWGQLVRLPKLHWDLRMAERRGEA